jgi:hypothetical protein
MKTPQCNGHRQSVSSVACEVRANLDFAITTEQQVVPHVQMANQVEMPPILLNVRAAGQRSTAAKRSWPAT